jgi:hypothetical protein
MGSLRGLAIVLIIIGIVAFAFQGVITYQTRETVFQAGSVEVKADKTHHIDVAPAIGATALVAGAILLVAAPRKS